MGRSGLWPILARIIGVIATLVIMGILLRLLGALLTSVLPPTFMRDLDTGWQLLYSVVGPAAPAVMALVILGALIWIIVGRR